MKKILTLTLVLGMALGMRGQILLAEDFNSCALPAGWTETILSGSQGWLFVLNSPDVGNAGNLDGTCMLMFDDDWLGSAAAPSTVELVSPAVDNTGLPLVLLEFDYILQEYGPALGDGFVVDVWDGTAWVNVFQRLDVNDCGAWSCGPPYPSASIDVTAYANPGFQVRITYFDGADWSWYFALDNLVLFTPSSADVGVSSIVTPVASGSCSLSSSEPVEVIVSNFGSGPAAGFDVCFEVSGPIGSGLICENVGALSLAPGASANYAFTATADLSTPGIYNIAAFTNLPGDGIPDNDSLFASVVLSPTPPVGLPIEDNFDPYANGSTVFTSSLFNSADDERQWQVQTGPTSSANTGPSTDASGTGKYIYIETSGSLVGDVAILETGCVDLPAGSNPTAAFAYHMYGASIDSLVFEVLSGASAIPLIILDKQQQFATTDPWKDTLVDLSSFAGQIIKLRWKGFVRASPSTGFTFEGDMALDNIDIQNPLPDDGGVIGFLAPASGCAPGSAAPVTVEIRNFGTTPLTAFDVSYSVNGGAPVTENVGSLSLAPLTVGSYTFTTGADLSAPGTYNLLAWTEVAGDANNTNDTAATSVLNSTISALPYTENFDGFTICGSSLFGCALDGSCEDAVLGGWEQVIGDDIDWSVTNIATPSTGTGPSGDHTSGTGNYLFVESSGCNDRTARLISPCFDLGAVVCPQVSFWYHMFGTDVGSITLEIDPGTGVWDTLWTLAGNQGDLWQEATVSLDAYVALNVRFRISARTAVTGFTSDMAIDDFTVSANGLDVAVQSIDNPNTDCELGLTPVTVTLFNASCLTAPAFDVVLEVDDVVIVTDTYPAGLAGLSAASHTFSLPFDFAAPGAYAIKVYTNLTGDVNPANDEENKTVASLTPPPVNTGFASVYCSGGATVFPEPLYPGGTWSGTGILDPSTGELDAALIGVGGSTDITYTFVPSGPYTVVPIPFGPEVPASPVPVTLTDDSNIEVPLGFSFEFFGNSYTSAFIGSNGYLTLGTGSTTLAPQLIPNSLVPNNIIAMMWTDLNPGTGGTINYATEGVAPNRRFVVTYTDVPHFGGATLLNTFQVILYEGTNIIDMQITEISTDGGNVTQGIENAGGTEAYTSTATSNLTPFTMSNEAYRYAPTPCGATVTETISVIAAPPYSLGPDTIVCFGTTALLDAGDGYESYLWSTGEGTQLIEVDASGTYSVVVAVSAGCSVSDDIAVTVSDSLELVSTVSDVLCHGDNTGSIDLGINGGTPPYTILWNTGDPSASLENQPEGIYSVTVTDVSGCSASLTDSIAQPDPLELEFLIIDATALGAPNGEILAVVSGGVPPYEYLWSDGQTENPAIDLIPATYQVVVTDANGCTIELVGDVGSLSGLNDIAGLENLAVFPNPNNGDFLIQLQLSNPMDLHIEVYNSMGQLLQQVASERSIGGQWDINLGNVAAGMYNLQIRLDDRVISRPVVVQN